MPRLDRRTLMALVVVAVVLGVYILMVAAARDYYTQSGNAGSTFVRGKQGLSVLYDYLDELGAAPVALQRFDRLPRPRDSAILFAADDTVAKLPARAEIKRLGRWVQRGGRLVVVGPGGGMLAEEMGLGASHRSQVAGDEAVRPVLPSSEAAGLLRPGPDRLLASGPEWVAHYKDIDGQVLISRTFGSGEVLWLVSVRPLSNAHIAEADNGDVAVALATGGGRRPYFDEYHHGYVRGGGLWEALRPRGRAAALVLLAALAVAMLARGRRLGAAIPHVERPAARSTAYIGQLAELYRKAGARSEALLTLEDGVKRALARRYGTLAAGLTRRPAVAEPLASAKAARERGGIGQDEFVAVAEKLRRAREEVEGRSWRTQAR